MKSDKLTRLLYFDEFKKEADRIISEEGTDYILVSMNISNFKYINDVYGYEAGDELLKKLADYFYFRNPNARLGSRMHADRFVILTEGNEDSKEQLFQRFFDRHAEFSRRMESRYPLAKIHVNAGACQIGRDYRSISEIVDKAELARKSIVDSYVENIAFYSDELAEKADAERRVIPMFEQAMKDERVLIYLQPKFTIDTQELAGAEALARIRDAKGNVVPPNMFIPTLEKTGMIPELDSYVVEQVYRLVKSWIDRGIEPVPVSVNLSRLDLTYETKWEETLKKVEEYRVPRQYIEYEVTETVFLEDMEYITAKLGNIQKMGYKVSMDDFGSGYSTLNTVGILPVDIIKLDRGFVQNSLNTSKGVKIMSGIIDIFKRIGLEVICEGVETKEEERMIASCGCNLVQGYLHDKPIPVRDFEEKYMLGRKGPKTEAVHETAETRKA